MSTGPLEISKITLDIWDTYYCGSNYGPYIEIESQNGEKRHTHFHGPFSKGTTLIWDNNGENRWGARNLGGVAGFQVTPFLDLEAGQEIYSGNLFQGRDWYYIKYRIIGGGGDDFCPKQVTFHTTDGKKYIDGTRYKNGMWGLWVDNTKGNEWRKAGGCQWIELTNSGLLNDSGFEYC